jgi:hypothetical protein
MNTDHSTIDPAWIAEVVREVIQRLTNSKSSIIDESVISVRTIEEAKKSGTPEIVVATNAVITPAARDEATRVGVAIRRANSASKPATAEKQNTNPQSSLEITDREKPQRAEAIAQQLKMRGITGTAKVVLSDQPSLEVFKWISETKQAAAAVNSLASVQRINSEMSPRVWVIDMNELNLVAAVNVVASIAKLPSPAL